MALLFKTFVLSSLLLYGVGCHECPNSTVPWEEGNCKQIQDAVKTAIQFLQDQMPDFDKPNNATLFDGGIVEPTVNISLMARQRYSWAASVPLDIYFDYVLPYANVNEARTNWRQILWNKLSPLADLFLKTQKHFNTRRSNSNIFETMALLVNTHAWKVLAPKGTDSIVFKSSQTPLIYDPMSTMLFGYASCTGISILYIDAMRTLGIPARLVGTPAWNSKIENGNHNWVEIWLGEETGWKFIEGQPTGVTETFENPCDKWFCTKSRFGIPGQTKVFASRFSKSGVSYQMAWDLENQEIPGVDRSAFYYQNCKSCGGSFEQVPFVKIVG